MVRPSSTLRNDQPIPATKQSTLSVLGAGPAGFALAVDLESHGTKVLLYAHPLHQRHVKSINAEGIVKVNDPFRTAAFHPRVTSDITEAIAFSTTLVITVPSTGHRTVFRELSEFDLQRHTVIVIPGNLVSLISEYKINARCILEANLSPYSCRMEGGELIIMGRKRLVSISPPQGEHPSRPAEELGILFPMGLQWCYNAVEVCLLNINGVFHPLMVLMNVGYIESTGGQFNFYADGLSRSVANAMLAVDRVRMKIGQAFGFAMKSVIEVSNECYGHDFKDLVDLAQHSVPHKALKAPSTFDSRNISEDVADVLVCWYGLAEKLGIDASPIVAVITLAGMAANEDYLKTGRNMTKLGLDTMSKDELIRRFGVPACQQSRMKGAIA